MTNSLRNRFPSLSMVVQMLVVQMLLQSAISIITLTAIASSAISLLAGSK